MSRESSQWRVKSTIAGLLLGAWSSVAVAQDSPAVEAAKAEARRIGERQCEHALIMQRINKSQPGTPERIKAEQDLDAVVERARREEERDDRYRASLQGMTEPERGTVNMIYVRTLGECGAR
jgi:vacuolar-type H+-ATPase subunit F/Vma7